MTDNKNIDKDKETTPTPKAGQFENGSIEVSRDHIYFYCDVTNESALRLNRILQDMAHEHLSWAVNGLLERTNPGAIWLHINSGGGSVYAGLSIADTILQIVGRGVPVVTIVEGYAASAATFFSIVGSTRLIRPNAYMLVHQISSAAWGNYRYLTDNYENNKQIMEHVKSMYKKYTKIPVEDIDEILRHDLFWDAKKCKKYGLVNDIL